ncbi:MAG: DUF2490 domain-containing protein [Crocinitomicaceae bacterium]|nr:DUF2490 domain-containing protein [Crocinitomicaceae bacterium]
MRVLLSLLLILGFQTSVFSQNEFAVWSEIGVKGEFTKKIKWSADLNGRFAKGKIETFFPSIGLEYKLAKWFRPSIDYRLVIDQNKYGNYKLSNRVNINGEFKKSVKRFTFEARLRYQYSFNSVRAADYDSEFDQAIRLKPEIEYDIKGSIFNPVIGAEFFYNPSYNPNGFEFTKIRFTIGTKLELDGPHSLSFKYQLDKKTDSYSIGARHVLSVSYAYKIN